MYIKIISLSLLLSLSGCMSTGLDSLTGGSTAKADDNLKTDYTEEDVFHLKLDASSVNWMDNMEQLGGKRWETNGSGQGYVSRYYGGWTFNESGFNYESNGCLLTDGRCNAFAGVSFAKVNGTTKVQDMPDSVLITFTPESGQRKLSADMFGNPRAPLIIGDGAYSGTAKGLIKSLGNTYTPVMVEFDSEYDPKSVLANFERITKYGLMGSSIKIKKGRNNVYSIHTRSGAIAYVNIDVFDYKKGSKAILKGNLTPVVSGSLVDFKLANQEFEEAVKLIFES